MELDNIRVLEYVSFLPSRITINALKDITPNPPSCIKAIITACPNQLNPLIVIVVSPVTHTALVAVKRASSHSTRLPLWETSGEARSRNPARIRQTNEKININCPFLITLTSFIQHYSAGIPVSHFNTFKFKPVIITVIFNQRTASVACYTAGNALASSALIDFQYGSVNVSTQRKVDCAVPHQLHEFFLSEQPVSDTQDRMLFEERIMSDQHSWSGFRFAAYLFNICGIFSADESPRTQKIAWSAGIEQNN